MTEPEDRVEPEPMAGPETSRNVDLAVALTVLAAALAGALYFIPNFVRAPIEPRPLAMAPWMLPNIAVAIMGLAALGLLAAALRRPRDGPANSQTAWGRLCAIVAAIAVFVLGTPLIGALPAAIAASLIMAMVGRSISLPRRLVLAVAGPVVVYLIFTRLAGTPLPRGPFL